MVGREARTLYCGFDPTADSLHIVIGTSDLETIPIGGTSTYRAGRGATGLIGDPSFKSQERVLNTPDIVATWVERLRVQMERFLAFDGDAAAIMANNPIGLRTWTS